MLDASGEDNSLPGQLYSDDMGVLVICSALNVPSGTGVSAAYRAFGSGGDVSVFAAGLLFSVYRDRPTGPTVFFASCKPRQVLGQFFADIR